LVLIVTQKSLLILGGINVIWTFWKQFFCHPPHCAIWMQCA